MFTIATPCIAPACTWKIVAGFRNLQLTVLSFLTVLQGVYQPGKPGKLLIKKKTGKILGFYEPSCDFYISSYRRLNVKRVCEVQRFEKFTHLPRLRKTVMRFPWPRETTLTSSNCGRCSGFWHHRGRLWWHFLSVTAGDDDDHAGDV